MIRKTTIAAALAILIFASAAAAQERPAMNLTLEEAIAKALKNNLNVAVEMFTPELAGRNLDRAREAFLPSFKMTYGNNRNENPSYWWLSGSGTNIDSMANYAVSVVEAIPTGGTFSLSLQNYKSETNQAFQLINPRYGSTLRLDFTQPLLKNFGPKVARRQITQAENNVEIADSQLRNTMIETVYLVQEGYWNLVFAIENFKVKEQSLQLGQDLLAKNHKEVEFGQLAPLEILNAEAAVAQREADLIQAEFLITRSEEVFKTMLNLAAEGDARAKKIPLSRRPARRRQPRPSFDRLRPFKTALREAARPEAILRKNIETKELGLAVARNQMLPALDLTLSYWSPGISGDRLIYDGNDFFGGIVIGKVPGKLHQRPARRLQDALQQLERRPDPDRPPEHRSDPVRPGLRPGRPEPEPGPDEGLRAAGRPGDQRRGADDRGQRQAGRGLSAGPRAGREEPGRRGQEAGRRACPPTISSSISRRSWPTPSPPS